MKLINTIINISAICVFAISADAVVLFSDSFDRPDNDLDANLGGMDGLLISNGTFTAGNTWLEPQDIADADPHKSWIRPDNGGELVVAEGNGTSHVALDHNFTDAVILTNGRFRVSLDLLEINSATGDRYLGFGVGMDAATANGNGDRYGRSNADLFVSATQAGEIQIHQGGVQVHNTDFGINDILHGATLEASFDVVGFNAGDPVQYEVFLTDPDVNGGVRTSVTSGSFNWSSSNANYIVVDGRASTRVVGDNLRIYAEEGSLDVYTSLTADPSTIIGTNTTVLNWQAFGLPSGSTYGISADKAVTFINTNRTGSADAGSGMVEAVVDGALGDVTFSMVFSNNLGVAVSTNTALVTARATAPPNVIVVLFDDTGWSDTGPFGSEVNTPTLDALASNGLRFRNFYQAARCSPSRCAILSGLYTQQAATDPAAPLPNLRTDNNVTIAEVLGAEGYHTYLSGKWHVGNSGGKYPVDRGFDHAYGIGANAAGGNVTGRFDYWNQGNFGLVSPGNEVPFRNYTNQFHFTDAIGDYAVDFINHSVSQNDGAPFFLYLAFNAPHWPVNAPAELADKYTDIGQDPAETNDVDYCLYEEGWDVIREKKYQRMLDAGIIDERWLNAPRRDSPGYPTGYAIPAWDTLSSAQQKDLARRMAVYAAMIEQVDANLGKVVNRVDQLGQLDNTLILVVNDNGSNYEGGVFGNSDNADVDVWAEQYLPAMGQPQSAHTVYSVPSTGVYGNRVNLGGGWSNVGNMPYRLFKHFTHNGGIRTSAYLHYPNGVPEEIQGTWSDEIGHLIDVMATVVDVTGADYPSNFNGHAVLPMEGESLMPAARGEPMPVRDIAVEHEANRAFFRGKWKFVTKNFNFSDGTSPAHQAELYNLEEDPSEMNNLASVETEKLQEMVAAWTDWVLRVYGKSDVSQLPSPKQSKWGPTVHLAYDIVVDANPAVATGPTDLFTDTFARVDAADADSFYLGMHGSRFAQMGQNNTYYEGYNAGNVSVSGTLLRMATADNGLMHNFIGQDILDAGGFSVTLAVVGTSSATSAGFGVGLSQAQASSASSGMASAADGFVELDSAGNLTLYNNGSVLGSVNVGSPTGTVTAAFAFTSFAASSNVDVTLFYNGIPALSGLSFGWDATGVNYIGLSAVADGYADLDNLAIRKLPVGGGMASLYALDSGLHGDDTDPARDADHDLLDQYAEWIWGGDPNVADYDTSKVVLTEAHSTNGFNFTYRRLKNAANYDVAYNTYVSTDLTSNTWTMASVDEVGTTPDIGNPNYETVQARIPAPHIGTNDTLFVLVRAEASD